MKYLSLTVETTTEAADIISLILMEEGSDGVSIIDSDDLDFVKKNVYWDYAELSPMADKHVYVTGVFPIGFDPEIICSRLREFKKICEFNVGSLSLETKEILSEDYENEWKKHFGITEYDRLAIVPSWLNYQGNKPALIISPGKAFGTGAHESTAMCLSLMQSLDFTNKTVLDVGCGSGILGLSAAIMGAKKVVLTDIDAKAVEDAKTNARENKVSHLVEIKQESFAKGICADIILANLTADLLIKFKPFIKSIITNGGFLIISGIINDRATEIQQKFSEFKQIKNLKSAEWQSFLYAI